MINLVSCQELLMILLVLTVEGVALLAESLLQRRRLCLCACAV